MSKIYNVYSKEDAVERTWYSSSNILYSECYDLNDSLKTLRVVFNNGGTYDYIGVDVYDYLKFREALSQGKALNQFIKKYEVSKVPTPYNTEELRKQLENILEDNGKEEEKGQ